MSRPETPPPGATHSSSAFSSPHHSSINLQQLSRTPSTVDVPSSQQYPISASYSSSSASAPADVKIGKRDVEEALLGKDASGKVAPPGNPVFPVMAYCGASIMMTVVNKFVVSGHHFSMTFLLLTIQSVVCCGSVYIAKKLGLITFRDFDMKDAKIWFPISALLVSVIYTGSKSLQFLSIPVYTIFKNLTIILIAYGEVIWFGGHVTGLTLCSFALMVGSSVIAAWSDISTTLNAIASTDIDTLDPTTGAEVPIPAIKMIGQLNVGYVWMAMNCFFSAAYVLSMRKRIKLTGFRDWDSMFYNNLLCIPVLIVASVLVEDWGYANLNLNFPADTRGFLLFAMAFSGAAAVFISYTTAWCIRTTSSTTYSMVGALNKLPVAASGMIFFGDPVNFGSVSAVSTGFIAGLVYAIAKQAQSRAQKAKEGLAGSFGMKEKS